MPDCCGEYEYPYLLFFPTPLGLFYYSGFFLRGDSDNILRIATLAISELAILAGFQFLLYATEGGAPDYSVGSLRLNNVGCTMLFWLPSLIRIILSYFSFYKAAERMRMDQILVVLAFHHVTEVDWFFSGGSDYFAAYDPPPAL